MCIHMYCIVCEENKRFIIIIIIIIKNWTRHPPPPKLSEVIVWTSIQYLIFAPTWGIYFSITGVYNVIILWLDDGAYKYTDFLL